MIVSKTKFIDKMLPWIYFFSGAGYYVIMILMFQLGLNQQSRIFTIPIRLLPVFMGLFIIIWTRTVFTYNKLLSFTLIYLFTFYLLRLWYDLNFVQFDFFMGSFEYFLFVISHFCLPLIYMSSQFSETAYEKSRKVLLNSSIAVSVLGFIFYFDEFSQGSGRLTTVDAENIVISPLAMSYVSLIPLVYYTFKLLQPQSKGFKYKIGLFVPILLSFLGLFLGASRGSILAFVLSIIFIGLIKKMYNKILLFAAILFFIFPLIYSLSSLFGSNLFDRVLGTVEQTQSGEYLEEDRPYLWLNAIRNFLNNPIIGDLIENRGIGHHPHNVIIEAFMAMGILGGTVFLGLILLIFKYCFYIGKASDKFDWVIIFFFVAFSQNMVSGGIWGAIWLWTSSGSIIGIYHYLRRNENINTARNYSGLQKTFI